MAQKNDQSASNDVRLAMQPREGRTAQKRSRKDLSQITQSAKGDSSAKPRRVGQARGLKAKATKLSVQQSSSSAKINDIAVKLSIARRMSSKQLSNLRIPNLLFLGQNLDLAASIGQKVDVARIAQVSQKSTRKLSI